MVIAYWIELKWTEMKKEMHDWRYWILLWQRAFVPIPYTKPASYIFQSDEDSSKYPKRRQIPLTVTPAEAKELTAEKYSPKYQKNISIGVFHGPPDSQLTRYQSASAGCHTWPRDPQKSLNCKAIRKYAPPTREMAPDSTTHRDHYNGQSIEERYRVKVAGFPPLEQSTAQDEKVAMFENCSRSVFWNSVGGGQLRQHQESLTNHDENYRCMGALMERNQPAVDGSLRPMKRNSAQAGCGGPHGRGGRGLRKGRSV